MSKYKEITEGEMQTKLEAALEHASHAIGSMRRDGNWSVENGFFPPSTDGREPGSTEYHLAAMTQYVFAVFNAMHERWGSTEGQLCPHDNCAQNLGLDGEGWYLCPNCRRLLFARVSDSDHEDYHAYRPDDKRDFFPEKPKHIPMARDLGKSWASPKPDDTVTK